VLGALAAPFVIGQAGAAESLKAYSIWPENYARPMLEAFEKASGIHVNFIRFSSGEAWRGCSPKKAIRRSTCCSAVRSKRFTAGEEQGIFEAYTPPSAADLPKRFKSAQGMWTAIADDPLVFMTNTKFLQEHNLQPPASWDDLLNPAYKSMLQMADARTSGTAVTRIFSILQVNDRNEDAGFAYMKKLRQNIQAYTKSGGGGTIPVGLGRPAAHLLHRRCAVHQAKGLRRADIFSEGGDWSAAECIGLVKGNKNGATARKLSTGRQVRTCSRCWRLRRSTSFPPIPKVAPDPDLAAVLKQAKIIEIDDRWAGDNRKRIIDRWVAEVLTPADGRFGSSDRAAPSRPAGGVAAEWRPARHSAAAADLSSSIRC